MRMLNQTASNRARQPGSHRLPMRVSCKSRACFAIAVIVLCSGQADWQMVAGQEEVTEESVAVEAVEDGASLQFTRVHVPRGQLALIPLGATRYVPMSVLEFNQALDRVLQSQPPFTSQTEIAQRTSRGLAAEESEVPGGLPALAVSARYAVAIASDGTIVGSVAFDVSQQGCVFPEMPLGALDVKRATLQTVTGTGEALVFGKAVGGGMLIATPTSGTYSFEFRCRNSGGSSTAPVFSLPLVPALSSTICLRLPEQFQPVIRGAAALHATLEKRLLAEDTEWRISIGPLKTFDFSIEHVDQQPPALALWTDVFICRRQATLSTSVHPSTPWNTNSVVLQKDPAAVVNDVSVGRPSVYGDSAKDVLQSDASVEFPAAATEERQRLQWSVSDDQRTVTIPLPAFCQGSHTPLSVTAVAPFGTRTGQALPLIRAPAALWSGGGVVLHVDAARALSLLTLTECIVVSPEEASRWPTTWPTTGLNGLESGAEEAQAGVLPSLVHIEQQGSRADITVATEWRVADVEVARVTTVDVSPGIVIGRAACDIRVNSDTAFDLRARVMPGWVIDSVETIQRDTPTERADAGNPREVSRGAGTLEWKTMPDPQGDWLQIGLSVAVTPARNLGLRISGHHAGLSLNTSIASAELDMVRFDQELEDLSVVEMKTTPELTIEVDDAEPSILALNKRLEPLSEGGRLRGRIRTGRQSVVREIRLVRRSSPLEVRAQVRLNVRDERLTQSFTFECNPSGSSEVDTILVRFSEPMDDLLEWSLLSPAGCSMVARRVEQPAHLRRDPFDRSPESAESWMIELNPPMRESVSIRAIRTISFQSAVPFPLAWIDGAVQQVGVLTVRDTSRQHARVINRRLDELPIRPGDVDQSHATRADFSFNPGMNHSDDALPVGEIIPNRLDANQQGQAWVWSESTACWCHASGATEYETLFAIENRDRATVALSVPVGKILQGILVDGSRLSLPDLGASAGNVSIALPVGRRFVQVLVRSIAAQPAGRLLWEIDSFGGAIDVPVLEREWRVSLPPELEIAIRSASHRPVARVAHDWTVRLLGANVRPPYKKGVGSSASAQDTSVVQALSLAESSREEVFVPTGGKRGSGTILLVHTRVISAAAILAAVCIATVSVGVSRARPWLPLVFCLITAVVALWVVPPFDSIARAAWWGSLAAVGLQSRRAIGWPDAKKTVAALTLGIGTLLCEPLQQVCAQSESETHALVEVPLRSAADSSLRVYMLPVEQGQVALVPESLFRVLAQVEAGSSASALRVIESRVIVARSVSNALSDHKAGGIKPAPEPWRLVVDVDVIATGSLLLDQTPSGARWIANAVKIDGVTVDAQIEAEGRRLRVAVPQAGRHRIELAVEPSVISRGDVETSTICVPSAPSAFLECTASPSSEVFSATAASASEQCESASPAGIFMTAMQTFDRKAGTIFDIAGAAQVRLARTIDPRLRLAGLIKSAESQNSIAWNNDGCRVQAAYEIQSDDEVVRAIIVRVDPRLSLIEQPDDELIIEAIQGHRYRIERREPLRGRVRIGIAFAMHVPDPVGIFDLPGAWLEGVAVDERTTHLVTSRDLAAKVDLPASALSVMPRDAIAVLDSQAHSWRVEHLAHTNAHAGLTNESPQPRMTVERRPQKIRGSQSLSVTFAPDQVRLQLQTQLNASAAPLVTIALQMPEAGVIDRLRLIDESAVVSDGDERLTMDLRWSRVGPGRVVAVVQRPRTGHFRLEVDARLPGRPPATGHVPIMRVDADMGGPLMVTWRVNNGLPVAAPLLGSREPVRSQSVEHTVEFLAGQPLPQYAFENATPALIKNLQTTPPPRVEVEGPPSAPLLVAEAKQGRVELTAIHLVLNDRGRAWGLVHFDLVAAEPLLRLRLPAGMRLFEALVDGHVVDSSLVGEDASPGIPQADNVWQMRLLDVSWPRSLLAVFAGDLGAPLLNGSPLELMTPTLIGLPSQRTIWTLQPPAGVSLLVAEPALIVDEARKIAERRTAMHRLKEDFERAIAGAGLEKRVRLEELLRLIREDQSLPLIAAWEQGMGSHGAVPTDASAKQIFVVANKPASGLTLRAVWKQDPTVSTRAIATVLILFIGGLLWSVARQRTVEWDHRIKFGALFFFAVLGLTWLLLLSPMWPGWIILIGAIVFTISGLLLPTDRSQPSQSVAMQTEARTVTGQIPTPLQVAAYAVDNAITQIALSPGSLPSDSTSSVE